jgi:hypothetical protein
MAQINLMQYKDVRQWYGVKQRVPNMIKNEKHEQTSLVTNKRETYTEFYTSLKCTHLWYVT